MQRFELAKTLVSQVLDFRQGDWLHNSFSALSIICFPDVFSTIAESLASVYFIEFNNSRTNTVDAYTVLPLVTKRNTSTYCT